MKKILTRFRESPEKHFTNPDYRFPIYVLLENIRSLYNVGSIFRTSDAARIAHLYLCGITGHPPRKEIDKTALGAQNTVPWSYSRETSPVLHKLKKDNIPLIAVEHTDTSRSLWDCTFPFPACFLFGYEIDGLAQQTLDMCDYAVSIPMYGHKGSLNVAVATAIILYQALEQFRRNAPPPDIKLDSVF